MFTNNSEGYKSQDSAVFVIRLNGFHFDGTITVIAIFIFMLPHYAHTADSFLLFVNIINSYDNALKIIIPQVFIFEIH